MADHPTDPSLPSATGDVDLREQQRRLRALFAHSYQFMGLLSPDGTLLEANDSALAFIGASRADVIGRPFWDTPWWRGSEDSRRRLRAAVAEAATGRRVHFPAEHLDKGGAVAFIDFSLSPAADASGRVEYLIPEGRNIPERKEAAERARAVEERLQHFVAETADVLYAMRVDGQILDVIDFVAPAAERIYGRPSQAFLENPNLPMEVVHPDDRPGVMRALEALLATGHFEETYRIVRPDGSVRWLHDRARVARNDAGQVVRIDGIARDVTERKAAEEQVRAAEALSQSIIESAVDGIIVIDDGGTIERVNPSGCRLFGYADAELVGRNVQILMPAPYREQHDGYLAHYRATGERRIIGIGREVEGLRKDGSTFPLFLSVSELWLPQGRRFAGILRDLTALKDSEAEVERSHVALRARAAQLERQTHQLRRLASEVTLAETRAREAMAKTLHDGLQQLLFSAAMKLDRAVQRGVDNALVERARGEVRDAIAAARSLSLELHPPALRAGNLPAALSWLAEWMHEKYRLTVRVSTDPEANPAHEQVRQLLFESVRELLFNTVKYSQVDRAALELAVRDDILSITVSDEGVGFDVAAILGPAREYHGGLGLFGIRERVTLLGGQVHLDSAPGRGTRVTLSVPFGAREPSEEPSTAADRVVVAQRRDADVTTAVRALRILLVDDHALVREELRELLAQHPEFVVIGEAADGHEALHLARTLHPDVVLMDVSMPGMDGVEATRRLHAELPNVRVYGLSRQEPANGRHPIEDAGAVAYFTKATATQPLVDRLRAEHAATGSAPGAR